MSAPTTAPSKRRELLTFFLLAAVLFPVLSVAVVGAYGLSVWMYQIVNGPPGM